MKITTSDYLVIDHYADEDFDWLNLVNDDTKREEMLRHSEEVVNAYLRQHDYVAKWGV